MASVHQTVLLNEAIEGLNLEPKSTIVDATFGGGGHSAEICRRYPGTRIVALDQDKSAWKGAKDKFTGLKCNIYFFNENFRNLNEVLAEIEVKEIDGILFDLGLSSDQLEISGRGFSFIKNEPLLMTMKESPRPEDTTAFDVVNTWSEENLADIIYGYGEEKYAKKIARGIAAQRENKKIATTFDLVEVIKQAVPASYKRGKLHFATRTFQAIRIAVNDELGALSEGLSKGFDVLREGGRMSVISFHSLEDRIVKKFFVARKSEGTGQPINKKIIIPSVEEIKNNPRARSAKLRILEKK